MITVRDYLPKLVCIDCLHAEDFVPYLDDQGEYKQHYLLDKLACERCGDKTWGERFGGLVIEERKNES
jgi:hypothetical protein